MKITIYGASDDLVEVDGCPGADEFDVYSGSRPGPVMWRGDLIAPGAQAMRVHALFDGCWHVAVGQIDEDYPLPDWPMTIGQHPDAKYSARLEVEAPDGTMLVNVWPGSDGRPVIDPGPGALTRAGLMRDGDHA